MPLEFCSVGCGELRTASVFKAWSCSLVWSDPVGHILEHLRRIQLSHGQSPTQRIFSRRHSAQAVAPLVVAGRPADVDRPLGERFRRVPSPAFVGPMVKGR
jgi:hypothetical protein